MLSKRVWSLTGLAGQIFDNVASGVTELCPRTFSRDEPKPLAASAAITDAVPCTP